MKKLYLLAIALLSITTLNAQLTQTGKDNNSILLSTSSVGFSITDAKLSANYYFGPKLFYTKSSGVVGNFKIESKNKDGIGDLFKSGYVNPSSRFDGSIGYFFSNMKDINKGVPQGNDEQHYKDLTTFYNDLIKAFEDNTDTQSAKNKDYWEQIKKIDRSKTPRYYEKIKEYITDSIMPKNSAFAESLNKVIEKFDPRWNKLTRKQRTIDSYSINKRNIIRNTKYWKLLLYVPFGIYAETNNLFNGWDTTNFANSLSKDKFRGGNVGFAVNARFCGRWSLGAKYLYQQTNNSALLSTTTYKVTSETTNGNNKGSSTDETAAYAASKYASKITLNRMYVDLMHFVPLKNDTSLMLLDLYFRKDFSSDNKMYPGVATIGLSTSFYKSTGKFSGGFYIELPDITQVAEKIKDEDKQNFRPSYNRISFGVFAAYTFNSMYNIN